MFYTSQKHFEALFENTYRSYKFNATTAEEFSCWQANLRNELFSLVGCNTMTACDPNIQTLETVKCKGYTRIKMLMNTEPDVVMPFYMLKPDSAAPQRKNKAVIACHGHCGGGKDAIAGVCDIKEIADAIEEYNYNYGEQLAQKGYLVFCPDARGFGERREHAIQGNDGWMITGSSCSQLNSMAIPLGQTVTGMWLWDLMRLTDYIVSREDTENELACVGLSGGGLQSLWLSSMDDRIQYSVVSGYFYGFSESLLSEQCCSCNYVPNLWKTVDVGDIGALIAPRHLVIETGSRDSLNGASGLKNVISQVRTVKDAMQLLGKPNHFHHDIFGGEHRFHGQAAFEMLEKHYPIA